MPDAKPLSPTLRDVSLQAALNHPSQLKELLKRPEAHRFNERDEDGDRTPLHWAAARGHQKCVEALMAAGADVGIGDGQGRTAAELARVFGHDAIGFLLEYGPPEDDAKRLYEGLNELSMHSALNHSEQLKKVLAAPSDRLPLPRAEAPRLLARCVAALLRRGLWARPSVPAGARRPRVKKEEQHARPPPRPGVGRGGARAVHQPARPRR